MMIGKRIRLVEGESVGDLLDRIAFDPGAYGSADGKDWFCCTPNGLFGNLSAHKVIEHADGTITITPSILVTSGKNKGLPSWHGYLTNGVWREC